MWTDRRTEEQTWRSCSPLLQFCEGAKEAHVTIYEDSICWVHTNTIFEHLDFIDLLSYNMFRSHRLAVIRRKRKYINGKVCYWKGLIVGKWAPKWTCGIQMLCLCRCKSLLVDWHNGKMWPTFVRIVLFRRGTNARILRDSLWSFLPNKTWMIS